MTLLAVDLGLKTGLALFSRQGRLLWQRSHNFGSQARLKRGAHTILKDLTDLEILILEGGGPLAKVWEREGIRQGLVVRCIAAETWRSCFLLPRQQASGTQAKQHAGDLARRVIRWSKAPNPTSLRHDAAEAVLTGLWGVLDAGWLDELPSELK